jgi:hypothetical protein
MLDFILNNFRRIDNIYINNIGMAISHIVDIIFLFDIKKFFVIKAFK